MDEPKLADGRTVQETLEQDYATKKDVAAVHRSLVEFRDFTKSRLDSLEAAIEGLNQRLPRAPRKPPES